MKAIIPAKADSQRVKAKNYRPFYGDASLVDLLICKLKRVLPPSDIYLSCEDASKRVVADSHGIKFNLRDPRLADNATPYTEVIRALCAELPGEEDVLWCQAIDPFFDQHADCIREWRDRGEWAEWDSLVVVYPFREYLLNEYHVPQGFGFGPWHKISQRLPKWYRLNFACAIMTRESVRRCGYLVGERPLWYEASGPFADIDHEGEFRTAQALYKHLKEGC